MPTCDNLAARPPADKDQISKCAWAWKNQWRYFYVFTDVWILTLQLWIQTTLITASWEHGLSISEHTTAQYLHLQSNQMLKPTGLPDCPIQANEDAANIELKQEGTIAHDSVLWQETGTLGSRHRQSTLYWGNGKGLGSKPGEGPSVPVLKR